MTSVNVPGSGPGATISAETQRATRDAEADRPTARSADAAGGAASESVDAVAVSASARQAAAIDSGLEREPFFDAARVARLRSAIQNGEYRIDLERLAQAITRFELGAEPR